MSVYIGSARSDERGKLSGGAAGDQTGKEVSYQTWYKHSKGWVVLRAKDKKVQQRLAYAMKAACDNNKIGYDQGNRNGLYNTVKNKGFDPTKCTANTETDCSALVRVCVSYAANIKVADFNTASELSVLKNLGIFNVLTDTKYTTKADNLLPGDILVTKTKGHTVIVISNDKVVTIEIAKYTLRKGNKGSEVRKLQQNLNDAIGAGLSVDGDFGTKTFEAVKLFQSKYGLVVDGIYGKNSYNKMKEVLGA